MDCPFHRRVRLGCRSLFLFTILAFPLKATVSQDDRAPDTARSRLFFSAVKNGNLDRVKALIDKGIDVNIRDDDKWTPLLCAASFKQVDVMRLLIRSGADVKAEHYLQGTALHVACHRGMTEGVRELIKAGADVNSEASSYGPTPLHCAADINNAEIIELLIKAGAKIDSGSMTPLTSACRTATGEKTTAIKALIDAGANLNPKGDSPLHWSCSPAVTKLLIAAGADVNHRNDRGQTPLHLASGRHWGPREAEFALMIAAGAEVNVQDKNKSTPLHQAVMNDFPMVVQVLIKAGANVDARDADGNTPLSLAQLIKSEEIVKKLKDAGANDGLTLLGRASLNGDLKQVENLLAAGSVVDEKGPEQKTALHLATEHDHVDIARALIAAKADVNARDMGALTPLHLVKSKPLAQALLAAGAKTQPEAASELGTPLFIAATEGRVEIVEVLLDADTRKMPSSVVVWVTFYGRVDVLRLMLSRGASANANLSIFGPSALIVATTGVLADVRCPDHVTPEIRLELAKLLIEAGAKVKSKSDNGYFADFTPLHAAATTGEAEMVKLLLQHKANPNAAGAGDYFAGMTPLHLAAKGGHLEAVKLLLNAGADVNAVTGNTKLDVAKTPLSLATSTEVRSLLIENGGK